MLLPDLQHKTRTLIAQDQLQQATEELLENIQPGGYHDSLIIQSAKLHAVKKAFLEGRIDYQEEQKQFNQLRTSLLELLGRLKEEDLRSEIMVTYSSNIKGSYQESIARITILWILIRDAYSEKGLTITGLYALSGTEKRKQVVKILNELNAASYIKKY